MTKFDLSVKSRARPDAGDISALLGGAPSDAMVMQLPVDMLTPYPNQPFKPYSEEKLMQLSEDIAANGVLSPLIVRPQGERYEILAGHNRWNASKRAGKTTVPAIVMTLDDDAAALVMVNTNLNQREELLPSEKAFAYKVQLETMKRQGKRSDLTSCQLGTKLRTDEKLAETTGDSARSVQRYIRLTELIPELLGMVDNGDLSVIPAVSLSYLSPNEQRLVLEVSAECEKRVSVFQAEQLKGAAGSLDEKNVKAILIPKKTWNPQQEFVIHGRSIIPKSATSEQLTEVLTMIENYFKEKKEDV